MFNGRRPFPCVCVCVCTLQGGVRAYALIGQGFEKHPNVTMVALSDVRTADLVVWLPGSTKLPPPPTAVPARKLVVVDFGDGFQPVGIAADPTQYGLYFKRSWVTRKYPKGGASRVVGVPSYAKKRGYFPLSYSMADEFLLDAATQQLADVANAARTRPVVCTLRPAGRGSSDVRKQVLGWVRGAVEQWGLRGSAVGEVDHGGRRELQNKNYLQTMREARIVVTANPTGWEGDSRTWEALASGALVMVDTLACPLPFPLIDKVHVVYYDPTDEAGFLRLLKHYLDRPDEAKRIGLAGHAHAIQHHRTVNRADYVLNVALLHKDQLLTPKAGETTLRRRRLLGVERLAAQEEAKPPSAALVSVAAAGASAGAAAATSAVRLSTRRALQADYLLVAAAAPEKRDAPQSAGGEAGHKRRGLRGTFRNNATAVSARAPRRLRAARGS